MGSVIELEQAGTVTLRLYDFCTEAAVREVPGEIQPVARGSGSCSAAPTSRQEEWETLRDDRRGSPRPALPPSIRGDRQKAVLVPRRLG
jgi:hypothetical protein